MFVQMPVFRGTAHCHLSFFEHWLAALGVPAPTAAEILDHQRGDAWTDRAKFFSFRVVAPSLL